MIAVRGVFVAHSVVHGNQELHALVLCLGHHILGQLNLVRLADGGADGIAQSVHKGVSHTAADDQGIDLFQQVVDNADLVGNLGAAQDGDEGTLRVGQGGAHDGNFLLDQVAADSGEVIGHAGGRGMGSVGGAESVVDIDLSQRGHSLGQLGIIFGFALFKADVFQQLDLAVL